MKLAYVDLETSGLDPTTHDIIEAAVIVERSSDQVVIAEYECSLNFDKAFADPEALRINGWGTRPFPELVSRRKAVNDIGSLTDGALFIGNCPWFDDAFLRVLFRQFGRASGWSYHLIDVENLIAGRLGMEPPWDSRRVSEAIGVPVPEGIHSAMADARWSRDLYHAVMREAHDEQTYIAAILRDWIKVAPLRQCDLSMAYEVADRILGRTGVQR